MTRLRAWGNVDACTPQRTGYTVCRTGRPGRRSGPPGAEPVTREAPAELKLIVACVRESARAATNIGWITHDVREVADSTATIVSSVEALANTISELSASSTATSAEAQAVRVDTEGCETEMRGARKSMRLLKDRVVGMNERLSALENSVKQIADMAQTIEAISSRPICSRSMRPSRRRAQARQGAVLQSSPAK